MKVTWNTVTKAVILTASLFLLVIALLYHAPPVGEWDDFTLLTASLINDGNMSVSQSDVAAAKEIFPELASTIDSYILTGYKTGSGAEIAWYFGTYSAFCVPAVLLLRALGLETTAAFPLTNVLLLIFMMWTVQRKCRLAPPKKLFLLLLLIVNPIVFYVHWMSAEVFIYAFIVLTMQYWLNGEYAKAALAVSIVSTLNTLILVLGIFMIAEYLFKILKDNNALHWKTVIPCWLSHWKPIISYGLIYVIALVPFAYNFYYTGHISLPGAAIGPENKIGAVFPRMWAYVSDLNFGYFPYYSLILAVAAVMLLLACMKKFVPYLKIIACFVCLIFVYSFMPHINCGMSGIARYNVWGAPILLFAVVYYISELFTAQNARRLAWVSVAGSTVFLAFIIYKYNPILAKNTSGVAFTPIAQKVLTYCPALYNPLGSTFNSRVNHIDGAYGYELPLYYADNTGEVRKIRANAESADTILEELKGSDADIKWLKEQLAKLGEKESYVNIDRKHQLTR
ncbi:MAG: hypothetical protein RR284_02140 [Ruthenibacterium sp.]